LASERVLHRPTIYYGYYLVAAAFVAQFVSIGVISYVMGPFMLPMIEELGWTRAEYTISRSISQIVMGIAGFFIGAYVDRIGARPLMYLGTAVLGISLAAHSLVDELWHWFFLNGLVATLGCALIGNLVVNVTMAKWFVEKRGQVVAWAAMGVSLGGVIITPGAIYLIDQLGWREAWIVLAVLFTLLMIPAAAVMRRAPEDHGLHPDGRSQQDVDEGRAEKAAADLARSMTRAEALRTSTFYMMVFAFGLFTINIIVMLLQTVPYLTDAGFSRNQAALAVVFATFPSMLSKPVWGYFIDHLPAKPLAALGAAVTGAALLAVVFAVQAGNLVWIYTAFVFLGLGWGGMIPLQEVIWGSFFGRRHLGAVRSAGLPITLLISAAAPVLVSYYQDTTGSYDGAILAVAICNLVSAFLILSLRPPRRKQ
jgi:MFS family permease